MGTSKINWGGGGEPCDGLASHPGEVEILLVASCQGNMDKLWPDGPLMAFTQGSNMGRACSFPQNFCFTVLNFQKIFAFKPKVKTFDETELSFILCI